MNKPIYLDCNATTPIEEEVLKTIIYYLRDEFGNAGSRTHVYGNEANKAVGDARKNISELVDCETDEVIFTSGATESNNIALLGLEEYGKAEKKMHIISSQIEHKAILEPLDKLSNNGFEVELIGVNKEGLIDLKELRSKIREDTLLITVMHANNETGVIQPIDQISGLAKKHKIIFHTDAAQTYGKIIPELKNKDIDLISFSGHKIYGPKGIGGLIVRRNKQFNLSAINVGGGQEKGLRPGTLPVHLIAGLGKATEISKRDADKREAFNKEFKEKIINELKDLKMTMYGDQSRCLNNTLSVSFGDLDSEALMIILKESVAISNGSACTSSTYEPSHVLLAMGIEGEEAERITRWSWSHMTDLPDMQNLKETIERLI